MLLRAAFDTEPDCRHRARPSRMAARERPPCARPRRMYLREESPDTRRGTIEMPSGWNAAMSGMRARMRLTATRSTVRCARPPASPTAMAMHGRSAQMASSSTSPERPNSTGSSSFFTGCPSISSGSRRTASHEALTVSPPNGSNPETSIGADTSMASPLDPNPNYGACPIRSGCVTKRATRRWPSLTYSL